MDTNPVPRPDLDDPVWTVQHLAACFHVTVDTAREYTYRDDFPGSHLLGARLLWDREDVLAWFRGLPAQTAAARRRTRATPPSPAVTTRPGRPAYQRRAAGRSVA